ncbi:hypothetical protein D3C80_1959660 [compost metagenome]
MIISISRDVDSAQPKEARVNTVSPAANSGRKPMRLASAAKIASVMDADSR